MTIQIASRCALVTAVVCWLLTAVSCGSSPKPATAISDPVEKITTYDAFAVAWLGEEFDVDDDGKADLLRTAKQRVDPGFRNPLTNEVIVPYTRGFVVSYGTCTAPPTDAEPSCHPPLSMVFFEPCSWIGLQHEAVPRPSVDVRGVKAKVQTGSQGGDIVLATAEFTVVITASGKDAEERYERAYRAAANLRGANEKAAGLALTDNFTAKAADFCGNVPKTDWPPTPTPEPPPPSGPESSVAGFAIDADPLTAGQQTTRTVAVGSTFNVEVTVTSSQAWEAYQITLSYNDATLDGVIPNPDQPWTAAPVEGARGGNMFAFTTTPAFCTPSTQGASRFLEDDAGDAEWAMTCAEATTGTNHTGDGALVQFTFKCEAAGTANLTLAGIADTFLLDAAFAQYNDAQQNATITCQ